MTNKIDMKSMNLSELTAFIAELGENHFVQNRFINGFIKNKSMVFRI